MTISAKPTPPVLTSFTLWQNGVLHETPEKKTKKHAEIRYLSCFMHRQSSLNSFKFYFIRIALTIFSEKAFKRFPNCAKF